MNLTFGKKSLPFRYAISMNGNPWKRVRDIFDSNYYKCISSLCATNHYMYCYAYGPNQSRYHFVWDSKTGRGIRWRASNFGRIMPAIAADEEFIYYCYTPMYEESKQSPYYFPDILRTAIEEKFGDICKECGNPIIVKIKFQYLISG